MPNGSASLQHLLVIGGAGFIGSEFVRSQLRERPTLRITILDRLSHGGSDNGLEELFDDTRIMLVKGDARDERIVRQLARDTDATVNFATDWATNDFLDVGAAVHADAHGTCVLLEAAKEFRHQRFVQVSTDEVYGHAEGCREVDEVHPRNPYLASKVAAEMMVMAYQASYGLPTLITRGCRTFGPYQDPRSGMALQITRALQGLPVPVAGDGSGAHDYIHVEDHASAIGAVLRSGVPGHVYNIGCGQQLTTMAVTETVLEHCDRPTFLKDFVDDPAEDDIGYSVSCEAIQRLGWRPTTTFSDGVRATVSWYRSHSGWWYDRQAEATIQHREAALA